MSGERRAFLDRSPGEVRGVVLLDGRPERLLLAREDDDTPRLGARYLAQVHAVSPRMGLARLDLGRAAGTLRLRPPTPVPDVGRRLQVEVVAEPARDKPAALRLLEDLEAGGPAPDGPCRPLRPAPNIEGQLAALGCTEVVTGDLAREAADQAQAEALAVRHHLEGGVTLWVEPTRALTAVDVDLAEAGSTTSVSRANLVAVEQAARLLRLKALGGLAAIDLIGFPKDAARLRNMAAEAFAADGPQVVIAALSRFGVLEVSRPHVRQPLHEQLADANGRTSARTRAQQVVRDLERQGRFDPGARLVARCSVDVARLARPWVDRLGPRFSVREELGATGEHADIVAL